VLVRSADIRIGRLMGKTISLQHPNANDEYNAGPSNPATGGCFQVEAVYADNAFAVASGNQTLPSQTDFMWKNPPGASYIQAGDKIDGLQRNTSVYSSLAACCDVEWDCITL
jgi:hypothetical protein